MSVPGEVRDPSAVRAREVAFPGAGGDRVHGYLAEPAERIGAAGAQREGAAGLVVIHEAFGLNEHIRDVARRFANVGYVALAPDLYTREGAPADGDWDKLRAKLLALPDAQALGDLEGAVAFVREQPGMSGRVGCIGFCSGGRHALLLACASDVLDVAVDCWGGSITRATPEQLTTTARPTPVIELAGQLSCPLMIVVGAEDQNPSPADARALAERLAAAGKDFRIDVYDDAGHAFFADYRPTYRAAAAQLLWERVTRFLAERLAA